jgi:hypothetical protein
VTWPGNPRPSLTLLRELPDAVLQFLPAGAVTSVRCSGPKKGADSCPIEHKLRAKGGGAATIATSVGAHLRYQLDRDSQAYKDVYKQRTATERTLAHVDLHSDTCTGSSRPAQCRCQLAHPAARAPTQGE